MTCTVSHDPRFDALVLFNAELETLAGGMRWCEGPVWLADHRCLLFNDIPNDRTLRWSEEGGLTLFRTGTDFSNGQCRDLLGRLITCHHRSRSLTRQEIDGRLTTLVSHFDGKRLNSPNDVVVHSDGTLWFTDPLYGIANDYTGGRQASEQPAAVYRFDPVSGALRRVVSDVGGPNGLAFSPDERRLYLVESGAAGDPSPQRHIRLYDVAADCCSLSGGRVFHTIEPGWADGLRVDEHGNVWSSAGDGVHCLAPDGTLLGRVLVPERVANLCFGGPFRNRLFICATSSLYSLFLNTRGAQQP
ncbi:MULTISPECIES: SMP-30/gluconolactonase/LRE family protein [unclassified Cyanobium]|uniref:SMP-30/gluconolactonase/LRE family protein n=1 Tax=unclassified Cyanobium TaxID=2627006 RepID=UPI0020CE8E2F|nr:MULTISPECIES: SMP-30/gluconolactonase/LRE family protein [unclassified Cyanobium]MCP9834940.1 SMP-30/gluconolactonase/LRE family protein [Cyanobium sp. La Preciosa 7G6]MCP9937703.1 SMP-30/gluconolactonase/LRE family protein [Cyanobium sp. Aljojuca 7A6]